MSTVDDDDDWFRELVQESIPSAGRISTASSSSASSSVSPSPPVVFPDSVAPQNVPTWPQINLPGPAVLTSNSYAEYANGIEFGNFQVSRSPPTHRAVQPVHEADSSESVLRRFLADGNRSSEPSDLAMAPQTNMTSGPSSLLLLSSDDPKASSLATIGSRQTKAFGPTVPMGERRLMTKLDEMKERLNACESERAALAVTVDGMRASLDAMTDRLNAVTRERDLEDDYLETLNSAEVDAVLARLDEQHSRVVQHTRRALRRSVERRESIIRDKERKISELENLNLCKICMENDVNGVLVSCGHRCLCSDCFVQLREQNRTTTPPCPLCRTQSTFLRTFE